MHYKQNNKESKTYVQGLRQFGNTLPRGIRGILKKNGYNYSEIISKWRSLVGKDISENASPSSIKISAGRSSGTLVLNIKRGDEINVEYSKKKIIDKVNAHFGYKVIDRVKLQVFNSKNKKPNKTTNWSSFENLKKQIDDVKNKNIKTSLSNLLKTIKND